MTLKEGEAAQEAEDLGYHELAAALRKLDQEIDERWVEPVARSAAIVAGLYKTAADDFRELTGQRRAEGAESNEIEFWRAMAAEYESRAQNFIAIRKIAEDRMSEEEPE